MSETTSRGELTQEEQQERAIVRQIELEPLLANLAIKARETYKLLRPKAEHVSVVERDYPLRHQQASGMMGGLVADYLMIAFGDHHDLVLYQDYANRRSFRWKFERSLLIDDLLSEETEVKELTEPRSNRFGGGVMNIQVATYRYPKEVGVNPQYFHGISTYYNNFVDAEKYTKAFEVDLDEAVTRFR